MAQHTLIRYQVPGNRLLISGVPGRVPSRVPGEAIMQASLPRSSSGCFLLLVFKVAGSPPGRVVVVNPLPRLMLRRAVVRARRTGRVVPCSPRRGRAWRVVPPPAGSHRRLAPPTGPRAPPIDVVICKCSRLKVRYEVKRGTHKGDQEMVNSSSQHGPRTRGREVLLDLQPLLHDDYEAIFS